MITIYDNDIINVGIYTSSSLFENIMRKIDCTLLLYGSKLMSYGDAEKSCIRTSEYSSRNNLSNRK